MATADRMRSTHDWTCLFSDELSIDCMEMQLSRYQHRSTPVPSTGNVCADCRNFTETWTLLVADINTLEAFRMKCQRQTLDVRWWAHVSNAEVLQRSGLSTIGDILRHRRLSLFDHVASLDPGVPAHDVLRLRRQKANGQLEKTSGSPSQSLAQ